MRPLAGAGQIRYTFASPLWMEGPPITAFVFPSWANQIRWVVLVVVLSGTAYLGALVLFGASPEATDVGYMPEQPVAYSHALHAGELGMDCRYCHVTVEDSAHASIPATKTCMNCHANIWGLQEGRPTSPRLALVHESWATGMPIPWTRVHDLPDYAYFNHSRHVRRGVGCATCHGRVDKMEIVYQAEPLSMGWCLECHREPERFIRPLHEITNMTYSLPEEEQLRLGRELVQEYNIRPPTDCSTCHR